MGTDSGNTNSDSQLFEAAIKQIKGVISTRVVLDRAGNFEEIHILTNVERSPKQIVRDVETVIIVAFGIAVDHKIISVVQIGEENLKFSGKYWRPCIQSINTTTSKQRTDVLIAMSVKDKILEGTASGPNSPLNCMRMVAEAVLNGLEQYFGGKVQFSVGEVAKVKFGGDVIIVISVFLVCSEMEVTLLGVSFVNGDEREAVCKATLSAINRKIEYLSSI